MPPQPRLQQSVEVLQRASLGRQQWPPVHCAVPPVQTPPHWPALVHPHLPPPYVVSGTQTGPPPHLDDALEQEEQVPPRWPQAASDVPATQVLVTGSQQPSLQVW
jgi:hypothetical protein